MSDKAEKLQTLFLIVTVVVATGCFTVQAEQMTEQEKINSINKDETGTDPRGFSDRFMPYYRYSDHNNDIDTKDLTMFGMFGFESPWWAMTYEIPVVRKIDYGSADAFKDGNDIGASDDFPAGLPFSSLSNDGSEVGFGDANFRLFYMPPSLIGQNEKGQSHSWIFGFETTIPSATEPALGGKSWVFSPMFVYVIDTPWNGFVASMNFYDFDVIKDKSRSSVSRYRGRWYLMQPLTKPGKKLTDGIYLLPELQPIYDFENEKFSFWLGPELGKIVTKKNIVYLKPGWGIKPGDNDRDFTVEVGMRYFID